MGAAFLWAWNSDAADWVKVKADANGKLIISDADPFTVQQTTPENLRHLPHGSDHEVAPTYRPIKVDGDGHQQHDIVTIPEVAQATSYNLKHVPYGYDKVTELFYPLAVDADGVLQVGGAAAIAFDDLTDVDLTGKLDGDFVYYDSASATWKRIAHKDATTGVHGVGAGTIAKIADIVATKLDDFAAPDNNTDLNASTSAHGLLPKLDNAPANFLNGQGAWAVPPGTTKVSSGSYTGDSTVNRAIAHGLTVTPKIVFLFDNTGQDQVHRIFGAVAAVIRITGAAVALLAVTIADATNFYVGNATSYLISANYTNRAYYWVAIG